MKSAREHPQSVQRAKVGMIGLAIVVLLIGLASAIMRAANHDAPVAAVGSAKPDVVANMASSHPQDAGEPLAELGVAPATANQAAAPHAGH